MRKRHTCTEALRQRIGRRLAARGQQFVPAHQRDGTHAALTSVAVARANLQLRLRPEMSADNCTSFNRKQT
eukprot:6214242-Pleurochrysis_carterae.AAC.1